jgi:hypothetical protein
MNKSGGVNMREITYPNTITLEEYLRKLKIWVQNDEKRIDPNCDECYDTKAD